MSAGWRFSLLESGRISSSDKPSSSNYHAPQMSNHAGDQYKTWTPNTMSASKTATGDIWGTHAYSKTNFN